MATQSKLPFSWRDVDQLPDLRRLELALEHLPDGPVVAALRARRGRGRDDYPVEAMWRALVAGVVFQHASVESLLRELRRNPALLDLCGFDPLPQQGPPRRSVGRSKSGASGSTGICGSFWPLDFVAPSCVGPATPRRRASPGTKNPSQLHSHF